MQKHDLIQSYLKFNSIIHCLNPLIKIHAPLGDRIIDNCVEELGLDNPDGDWINSDYLKLKYWENFLSQIQQSYAYRRDLSKDLSDKRKWNQKLVEFEIIHQLVNVQGFPRRAYIEITKDCNLRCPMCPQSYEVLNRSSLPVSAIRFLDPCLPYLELVELFGFGEPLTATNFKDWMKDWPKIEGQTVSMTTNGILLNKEYIHAILKGSLNQIRISIDGVTNETYRKIRGVDKLDNVLRNLRMLVSERNRLKSNLNIWIKMVVSRNNIHELPEMVNLTHNLGVDFLEVMFLCAYTPDQWDLSIIHDRKLCNQMFSKAEQNAKKLKLPIHFPPDFDLNISLYQVNAGEFSGKCREPWEFIYLTNEGTVRTCCINMTSMGDDVNFDFNNIWNGEKFIQFRDKINTQDRQYRCRYCYMNYMYADVNNIRSHLIDLKPHFEEVGLGHKLHTPDDRDLENYIKEMLVNK